MAARFSNCLITLADKISEVIGFVVVDVREDDKRDFRVSVHVTLGLITCEKVRVGHGARPVTLYGNNDVGADRGIVGAGGEQDGAVGQCKSTWPNGCNKEGGWNTGEDECVTKTPVTRHSSC